jgi:1-deoxy-D-xylulose-5-phosphate reductoisomerase
MADPQAASELRKRLDARCRCTVLEGARGLAEVASLDGVDVVVAGLTGAAGLLPVVKAIQRGKDIALANKEVLVAAGALVTRLVAQHRVRLLPVDSEHSAILQCLKGEPPAALERILLTASGGPFRGLKPRDLEAVTPESALKHPNWKMGAKITIDSSTLMNKGLEVIEAHFLFNVPYDRIEVVIHPQSIIHSLVEFCDGSVIAQLGVPDMRLAILYALTHPERLPSRAVPRLDLKSLASLTFESPDRDTFRCLNLAYDAGRRARTYPTVLNAANEIAVRRFLDREIPYPAIPALLADVMDAHSAHEPDDLDAILEADAWARRQAAAWKS